MKNGDYLKTVRDHYEKFPYPARDPEDEKTRIRSTRLNVLELINYYCFRGKQDFNNFRILAAGDGTADSTIFLAEQLRDKTTEIVYLDLSESSMAVAKERAKIRMLNNIQWHHGSLLDIAEMGLGQFDYITCTGVLHHLADPVKGLKALKTVLKDDGAIGIMVYGAYGRTGVYQMQELMRLINDGDEDMNVKVQNTKTVMDELPDSNWWKLGVDYTWDPRRQGDIEIYDAFLHSQDCAYTVQGIYDYVESCDLNFVEFAGEKAHYRPDRYIHDEQLLKKINALEPRTQQAISELLVGNRIMHTFYAAPKTGTIASLDDLDNIPFFHGFAVETEKIAQALYANPGKGFTITRPDGFSVRVSSQKHTQLFFKHLGKDYTLGKLFKKVKKDLPGNSSTTSELLVEFKALFKQFNDVDWMFLRDKSVKPFKSIQELQQRITKQYQKEGGSI